MTDLSLPAPLTREPGYVWKEDHCVHRLEPLPTCTYRADVVDGFNGVYLELHLEVYDVEEGKHITEIVHNELERLQHLRNLRFGRPV